MKRLLPVLLLSACAALPGTPVPQEVRLSETEMVLRLSDGTRCVADWQAAPVGRLEACGPGYGYAVTVADRPNFLRQLADGLVLAAGLQGVLAPVAEVVITDPAGIDHVFRSPPPRADD
jgi:hypothetical protein